MVHYSLSKRIFPDPRVSTASNMASTSCLVSFSGLRINMERSSFVEMLPELSISHSLKASITSDSDACFICFTISCTNSSKLISPLPTIRKLRLLAVKYFARDSCIWSTTLAYSRSHLRQITINNLDYNTFQR